MKVCLISPPTVTEFNQRLVAESEALRLIAEHAPMGILSLAAVLERQGIRPEIIDLNRLYYQFMSSADQNGSGFCGYVIRALAGLSVDVFGFSTICSSYPLTLRLAKGLRQSHPEATIILGGPQASVVDLPTLKTYPFIDLIVRGEAEETLPRLLEAISSKRAGLANLGGITYRRGQELVRNPNAPVIEDLDSLPAPAFHLYPYIKDCSYAPIEAGRGCPFACSFCSTNDFFRRRFRMKSPQVLVAQMIAIKNSYGIDSFDLVHDMFTVDRKKVLSFCEAVERSGEDLYWSVSARTDCLDDEMISHMARAGCNGIFFGIDTGSERMQAIIHKRLDMAEAASRIKLTNRHGIKMTVSLITGFPEEKKADLQATIQFLGDSLHHQHVDIQLHLLAPLAETPITTEYQSQLIYDDIFSDISFQGWEQDPEERAMIIDHPEIFPNFYAVPTRWLSREYLRELREFILHGILRHRWLILLLHRDSSNLVSVFDEWKAWSVQARGAGGFVDGTRTYYNSHSFSRDLLRFVRLHYLKMATSPHLLSSMAEVESAQLSFAQSQASARPKSKVQRFGPVANMDAVPILAGDARMIVVSADHKRLIRALKRKERLDQIPAEQVALVLLRESDEIKIVQLNRITHELMRLCNGSRTVTQIAGEFSSEKSLGISPIKASMYGLASLAQKGLIDIMPTAN
ncbi:MAG: B12-binding domain-containing radical SAM protein [Pyrinomonadaceae bacterium]|nr:B12-binding domain-containing radical SAM protein [Pyrinomonadaceae bacterium]